MPGTVTDPPAQLPCQSTFPNRDKECYGVSKLTYPTTSDFELSYRMNLMLDKDAMIEYVPKLLSDRIVTGWLLAGADPT